MKRILVWMMAILAVCFTAEAKKTNSMEGKKVLVAYYSATGTTKGVAQKIAAATNGTLYAIEPQQKYTAADLDWNDKNSRSTKEMADKKSRPAIVKGSVNVKDFDVVYIGYPIWWDEAPRVINTFIESNDLAGKTVIPFATSGSSSISNSEKVLKATYPSLKRQAGKLLNRASQADIDKWVK